MLKPLNTTTPEQRAQRAEAYAVRAALGGLLCLLMSAGDSMTAAQWAGALLGVLLLACAAFLESVADELRAEAEAGRRESR